MRGATIGSCYRGKLTACHTFGLLGAFFRSSTIADLLLFEALTGVPYGVYSRALDANRLLAPWIDPDEGLDRALNALGVEFEVAAWPLDADSLSALDCLGHWLTQGPVLLGPLDMGFLPYISFSHLFHGCDHYVIALKESEGRFLLRDSEGYDLVWIATHDLANAWRGRDIPEGRGAFVMRRITTTSILDFGVRAILNGLRQIPVLLRASASAPRGGPRAYATLADEEATTLAWPAARRSLSYLLPTRMQRNVAATTLLDRAEIIVPSVGGDLEGVRTIIRRQSLLLAQCCSALMAGKANCLKPLYDVAELEERLTVAYGQMEESICDADLSI